MTNDLEPTFQITTDPLEIVIFAGADRWTLEAAAAALALLMDWWHAKESSDIADRDLLETRELENENYERATQELDDYITDLVYSDAPKGLS